MSQELSIEQKAVGSQLFVKIDGRIDDEAEFPNLNLKGVTEIALDLAGVDFINSAGIRRWVTSIWSLDKVAPTATIKLVDVRYLMLKQVMTVREFIPTRAVIASMFVPFYCDPCDVESDVRFKRAEPGMVGKMPTCPKCRGPMESSVLARLTVYGNFVKAD